MDGNTNQTLDNFHVADKPLNWVKLNPSKRTAPAISVSERQRVAGANAVDIEPSLEARSGQYDFRALKGQIKDEEECREVLRGSRIVGCGNR